MKITSLLIVAFALIGCTLAASSSKFSTKQALLTSIKPSLNKLNDYIKLFCCKNPKNNSAWTYSPSFQTTTCLGNKYVAPYGAGDSISTTFDVVKQHKAIVIKVKVAFIDSWDGESFIIKADGNEVFSASSNFNNNN